MKKNGIDHSTRLPCVSNVSVVLPRLPAATTPIQEPRKEDSTVAMPTSSSVFGSAAISSSRTALRLLFEVPRSPCSVCSM